METVLLTQLRTGRQMQVFVKFQQMYDGGYTRFFTKIRLLDFGTQTGLESARTVSGDTSFRGERIVFRIDHKENSSDDIPAVVPVAGVIQSPYAVK